MRAAAASWILRVARTTAERLRRAAGPPSFYDVLGLAPDADDGQIKTAYRALAWRFHPDINTGDARASERLAEINRAYETLADANARLAYDRELARQRIESRRRFSLLAAIGGGTFLLTTASVLLAVYWRSHGHTAPPAHRPAAASADAMTGRGAAPGTPALGSPEPGSPPSIMETVSWITYRDPRFDFSLRFPASVFVAEPAQSDANVQAFRSRDGRAVFRIVAAQNAAGITLASFRSVLIKERYAGASFQDTPRRRHWFALSGTRGDEVFAERMTFSCDGKSMHGWQMHYPASERTTYDALTKLILLNDPHGNGPATACDDEKPKKQTRRRRE